jgi:hypothetical protein
MNKLSFLFGESLDMYDNYDYDPGYNASGVLPDAAKNHPNIGQNIGHSNMDINFSDDKELDAFFEEFEENELKDKKRLKEFLKLLRK